MSMQISVDPAALSQEQREAVAGFILAYPGKACAGTCGGGHAVAEIHAHTHQAPVASGDTGPGLDPEIAALVKDDGEFQASVAFGAAPLPAGDPVAAAAFGVPPAPLAVSTPAIAGASTVAPPPPANTAPITTTLGVASSPTATLTTGVDLDAKGFPWDSRIHAESKAKIADGTWRSKRNLDPALKASVEAELRQLMGVAPGVPFASAPVAATVTAPAGSTPTPTSAPVAAVPPPPPAPVAGAAPTMPAAPSAAPGEVPADARGMFVALVGRASAAIQGQKVTQAEVNQCCADAGVPALPLLANRLDLVAQVAARVDALIAARQ